jgi:hypothetical protein
MLGDNKSMLALLAALALSSGRVLPNGFLSTRLQPILEVEHLRGIPRATVTRGGSWRPGGKVRLNYFYKFRKGSGPTHKQILTEPGFIEEPMPFRGPPAMRAVRVREGIRQIVWIAELDEGVSWRWTGISGPATLVSVSEIPMDDVPQARWHNEPVLNTPPIPVGFPPAFKFLAKSQLSRIDWEPILPRFYRLSVSVQVRLVGDETPEELGKRALQELTGDYWKLSGSGSSFRFARIKPGYGLQSVEIAKPLAPAASAYPHEVILTYTFADPENAPRIED